uniref:FKB95-like N-terminal Kelch domain-containing protein n=1 Tax=Brassica campestris TaxID=3711 RepID=M4E5Y0_BRACM
MKPVDETLTDHDDNHRLPHDDHNHRLPQDDYSLFPVPSPSNSILEPFYTSVAVGSELYIIGGTYNAPSSAVRILDCQTHIELGCGWYWTHANAFLLDEKIYVMGRWGSDESQHNWMEVLDITTQTWRHLRIHGVDKFDSNWFVTNVFEGKMYAIAEKKSYAYDTQEIMWILESERNKREPEGRIWCAKIALEKRESEVWGKIEWANSVSESRLFSSCIVLI